MSLTKIGFVTYFNQYYLLKGLAMLTSLIEHVPKAQIWVLAFDTETENILKKINLPRVHIITPSEFEDASLKKAKKDRSLVEYFWTCTPSLSLYVLKKQPQLTHLVYVDADMFFYSSPLPAFKELGDKEILTVEHRYPDSQKSREATSGRFNVGFQIFKQAPQSIKCLRRWRNQCLDWCYARQEDGKYGDQVYLNEWPELYDQLVISKNLGLNAAPWNITQYKVASKRTGVYIESNKLICYHFHQFDILGPDKFDYILGYKLSPVVSKNIYDSYAQEITKQYNLIKKVDPHFTIQTPNRTFIENLRFFIIRHTGHLYWLIQTWISKLSKS